MNHAIKVEDLGKKYQIQRIVSDPDSGSAATAETPGPSSRGRKRTVVEDFWSLRSVSFEVGVGERVGIIGRNGAGKSTLLKLLSRITAPSTGRISLRGRVASLLEVGTGFHPELTGRENIFINGSILGMRRREIQRKFDEIVSFSDVERFLDTPVKRYSSGMYMRLAFAVAAHLEPEILLVDEVLAVGDAAFQAKCLGKMDSISREGRTVLFVSHDMSAIATLCDRAVLLQQGVQAYGGDVDSVVSRYLENARKPEALVGRTDRSGTGSVRAVSISINDALGLPTTSLSPDVELELVLQLEAQPEALGKPLLIQLMVCDRAETRLFSLRSGGGDTQVLTVTATAMRIACRLPRGVPLMPDHYSLDLQCVVDGRVADKVANATDFEVVAKDIFGTGVLPTRNMGPLLVRQAWGIDG